MTARVFLLLGAVNAFLAVALGAFGAHGLRGQIDPSLLSAFETGVQYHGLHALGLLCIGLLTRSHTSSWLAASGWLLTSGILLFSGSLYLMALTGTRALGIITPVGGIALLAGWLALARAVWRLPPRP